MHVYLYLNICIYIYMNNRPGELGDIRLPKLFQQRLKKTGSLYVLPGAVRTDYMSGQNVRDDSGSSSRYVCMFMYVCICVYACVALCVCVYVCLYMCV
jgi:hypothetical protein